jgi:hypothetical protein
MPATAADLASVKKCEMEMDIDEIATGALSSVRFVTALNGEMLKEE